MKKRLIAIGLAMALAGCMPDNVRLLWDKPGPPDTLKTPEGFQVSPQQAYNKVLDAPWKLSKKHIWHIYADETNYYILDSFLGSDPKKAIKTGVIVDGQTGEMKN